MSKLGIIKNSNADYHKGEGLSSTGLKKILKSPAHFLADKLNPPDPKPEMIRGSIVHSLILEPETFQNEYFVGTGFSDRGATKAYVKLCEENPGKIVINEKELENANKIVATFGKHVEQNPLLQKFMTGVKEMSFYWEHKNGVLCKARPDILNPDGVIVDIKTAYDGSLNGFTKALGDREYHISGAHYIEGVTQACKQAPNPFIKVMPTKFTMVVIETSEPYPVSIYTLSPMALRMGANQAEEAIEKYAEAVATDTWPGYSQEEIEIDMPNYYMYKRNKK